MASLFGTDGIRGIANAYPIDGETAFGIGRAAASCFKSDSGEKAHMVIGMDTRVSGDMLSHAVVAGICAAGLNANHLGVMPTPAVAYLTRVTGAAAGVVISASHNPYADNGIKFFNSDGYKLSAADEATIEALIDQPGHTLNSPTAEGIGRMVPIDHNHPNYLNFLIHTLPHLNLEGLTLVLDCANGATYDVAPKLFQTLGAKVIPIFCKPNGTNINDQCGSEHPETLSQVVVEQRADLGLAFDGDGDRLVAVDETGKVLSGDQIMAICANHFKQKHQLKNNAVVSTVMSNMGFGLAMQALGIDVYSTQVGDRHVMEKMKAVNAVLGGEDSGHMIFLDKHTTGDGLMAGLQLLDAIRTADRPLSQLSKIMTVYPQELINVGVKSKPDLAAVPEIMNAVEQVEKALGDQGRVLVRYSGTQLMCRVMVEGPTQEVTRKHCRYLASVIREILA